MSTELDVDTSILEQMDYVPPCEHGKWMGWDVPFELCGAPSVWRVLLSMKPCGCPHVLGDVQTWCDDCMAKRLRAPALRCLACGDITEFEPGDGHGILSMERL